MRLGTRFSDVLALRYDNCLEGEGDRWFLVGGIHKTRVLGHHVPITADVASAIRLRTALVQKAFATRTTRSTISSLRLTLAASDSKVVRA